MNGSERSITSVTAGLLLDASVFMKTVAGLIADDLVEQEDEDGKVFLNGFRVDGLMRGLRIVSEALSERGEWLNLTVRQEERREEENKAALARRSGKTTLGSTNVGGQS